MNKTLKTVLLSGVLMFLFPAFMQALSTATLPITATNGHSTPERRIVVSSDGKMMLFHITASGYRYITSTDGGKTWSASLAIAGAGNNKSSSAAIDSNNNVYFAFDGSYGGAVPNNIRLAKFVYNGTGWDAPTETRPISNTGGSENHCNMVIQSNNRIWISWNQSNTNIFATYSDDGVNWNGPVAADASSPAHYLVEAGCGWGRGGLFLFNDKPAFVDGWTAKFSRFDGAAWTATTTITGWPQYTYKDFSASSAGTIPNQTFHLMCSAGSVKHLYTNDGADWTSGLSPVVISSSSANNPALASDGTNLWCFWTDVTTTPNNTLYYKKHNGFVWDVSATAITSGAKFQTVGTIHTMGANNAILPFFWYETTVNPYAMYFSKFAFAPKVNGATPATGDNASGTTVTISGQGFYGETFSNNLTSVRLDDGLSTVLTISSATVSDLTIAAAIVPLGVKAGTYNIIATTAKGSNTTSTTKFTVTTTATVAVTNLSPSIAGRSGTTALTIFGSGFFGGTPSTPDVRAITMVGTAAQTYTLSVGTVVSDTQINSCTVPTGCDETKSPYDIRVFTGGGNNTTSSIKLTVVINPEVTAVAPTTGASNASGTLTITGTGFGTTSAGVEWIRLASTDGLFTKNVTIPAVITETSIAGAIYPALVHAGTYNVQVRTFTGGNNGTSTQKVTIATSTAVTVTTLVPASGNNYFETSSLSISGTGFFGGVGEDDVRRIVLTSTTPVTTITLTKGTVTDTAILNCAVPSGVPVSTYDVIVTTGNLTSATSAVRYVVTSYPIVSTLSLTTGSNVSQHSGIIVTGSYFTGTTYITLSGPQNVTIGSFTEFNDNTIINMSIPSRILAGTYDVRVETPLGANVVSAAKWVATADKPTVTGITPAFGTNVSGVTVTVSGTGFYGGTLSTANVSKVKMYGSASEAECWSPTVISDTSVRAVLLSGSLVVGTYDVKVTNGGGESTGSVKFTVTTPLPTVTELLPDSWIRTSATTISILGTGFFAGTSSSRVLEVKLGTTVLTNAFSSALDANETLNYLIPAGLNTGRYPVSVTTTGGTSTIVKNFDVTFDSTDSAYGFTTSGVNFTIPQNTFSSSSVAVIVSTTPADQVKVTTATAQKYRNINLRSDLASTVREITASTGSTIVSIAAGKSIGVRFSYSSANINDSVVEQTLRVACLNNSTGLWEFVTGTQSVDLVTKEVLCDLTHFSTYRLVQYVQAANTLAGVVVYPNPVSFDSAAGGLIKFANLTGNPTLKVYTIAGELIKSISPGEIGNAGNDGKIEWDGKNPAGELIARGLYIYLVTDDAGGRKVGKFVVK